MPATPSDTVPFAVRLPRPLYSQLGNAAELNGHSKNKETISRLNRSFERESILAEMLVEGLGLEKYQRITSTTEENDIRRLFLFLENLPVDRIYLAARKDSAYGAVLVILIQSGPLTLYMDHAHFNTSTLNSCDLVMDLLANIKRLDLLSVVSTAEDFIPDTRDMNSFEAIDCYLSQIPFRKRGNISKLLAKLKE